MPRILIADDDDELRLALAQLLELEGFQIAGAPDGPAALNLAHQCHYDLILLDVKMPGPDGLEVLAALHAQLPDIPIIMMSGQTGRNTVANALRYGASDFIMKPFNDEFVLLAVRRALRLPG
ncbi:MAG: response regulator [Anaerolineales bacterium]|nr:response regulator [Anaerolineales bacterium]